MAAIVGDKLKLTNYSYLLNVQGTDWIPELLKENNDNRRSTVDKIIDAKDIDWRPYVIKDFFYNDKDELTYVFDKSITSPGDLFETERVLDFIAYSYANNIQNLGFVSYIHHNRITDNPSRPWIITNLGWTEAEKHKKKITYTIWPAVGSISKLGTNDFANLKQGDSKFAEYITHPTNFGETFNDYQNNVAGAGGHAEGVSTSAGLKAHAEGHSTNASGESSHAEGKSTKASGNQSHAEGNNTEATKLASHAEGHTTHATDNYSHAEGYKTTASNEAAHAEGNETNALNEAAHAEGYKSNASGMYSHAEGNATSASGNYSHSEGNTTKAAGESSHSSGNVTTAQGNYSNANGDKTYAGAESSTTFGIHTTTYGIASIAAGFNSLTYGTYSFASGDSTYAYGRNSSAFGLGSYSVGDQSFAVGNKTYANGANSHSEGFATYANGMSSHAEGSSSKAHGTNSHAEGESTYAGGTDSHAEGYSSYANGNYSHAEGNTTYANANYSHAEGHSTYADGDYSHAEGHSTYAKLFGAHAEGISTNAELRASHAEGESTFAKGTQSHAEGMGTYAEGTASHSEGNVTHATGNYSHSEGNNTTASNEAAHSEGSNTTASGKHSHAEGLLSSAQGFASHAQGAETQAQNSYSFAGGVGSLAKGNSSTALGYFVAAYTYAFASGRFSYAIGNDSFVSGYNNIAENPQSHAEGNTTHASGSQSHAEGNLTKASSDQSHAEGKSTIASGPQSHAEGLSTTASGPQSHAEGKTTTALKDYSHAEGISTKADNEAAHAEGKSTDATGIASHSEGNATHASGNYSHAEGNSNTATGTSSHVEGDSSKANGNYSHAEGYSSEATGDAAHAEGYDTSSTGKGSHSEGVLTSVDGEGSHAEGNKSSVKGNYSHAQGDNSSVIGNSSFASGDNSVVEGGVTASTAIGDHIKVTQSSETGLGKWNKSKAGYFFTVGDGNETTRRNAIEIDKEGWTYVRALASYINQISVTTQHYPITYEMDFVQVLSYSYIKRGLAYTSSAYQNSYNIQFNTYTLPTKNYIDKLLESKDVFRFAGTIHFETGSAIDKVNPNHTTPPASTAVKNVTWTPYVSNEGYTEDSVNNSYNDKDASRGAIWKAENSGFFGNRFVQGGDLILSYDDTATQESSEKWAIIDTHINFVENYGTYNLNAEPKNDDSWRRLLTNTYFSDSGQLTYNYTTLNVTYHTKNNKTDDSGRHEGFVSYISLGPVDGNKGLEITYNYTTFQTKHVVSSTQKFVNDTNVTYESAHNLLNDNISKSTTSSDDIPFTFINKVHLDQYGVLSYASYTINNLRSHHYTEDVDTYTSRKCDRYIQGIVDSGNVVDNNFNSYNTGLDNVYIVNNVNLSQQGHLTYTYTNLHNLKSHHNTYYFNGDKNKIHHIDGDNENPITNTSWNAADETNHVNAIRFVNHVNLSAQGTLTYTYLTIDGLRNHHHNTDVGLKRTYTADNGTDANSYHSGNNLVYYLTDVHLTGDGKLTYGHSYIENIRKHHHTMAYTTVDRYVDKRESEASYTSVPKDGNDIKIINNVHQDVYGTLTYTVTDLHNLRKHHNNKTGLATHTKTLQKAAHTYGNKAEFNRDDALDNTYAQVDAITVVDNVNLDQYGTLTYTYLSVNRLRTHHNGSYTAVLHDKAAKLDRFSWTENNKEYDSYRWSAITHVEISPEGTLSAKSETIFLPDDVKNSDQAKLAYSLNSYVSWYHGGTASDNGGKGTYIGPWKGNQMVTYDLNTHATTDNKTIRYAYNVHANTSVSDSKIDGVENKIGRFIDNVHLDKYGRLTYTIASVDNLRTHHDYNNEGLKKTYHIDVNTIDGQNKVDSIPFVTHVAFTSGGYLVTGHSVVNHLRTHHHTNTEIENTSTSGRKSNKSELTRNVDATETSNESLKVLTYASLNTDGVLQTWHANITNIRKHHHQKRTDTASYIIYNANNLANYNNDFGFISEIQLDEYGKLTYQTSTVSGLREHHTDSFPTPNNNVSGDQQYHFVRDVSITKQGTLSGSFGHFANTQGRSTQTHNHRAGEVTVMTYSYIDPSGKLTNRYEKITLNNQKVTATYNGGTATSNTGNAVNDATPSFVRSAKLSHSTNDNNSDNTITMTYVWDSVWGTL